MGQTVVVPTLSSSINSTQPETVELGESLAVTTSAPMRIATVTSDQRKRLTMIQGAQQPTIPVRNTNTTHMIPRKTIRNHQSNTDPAKESELRNSTLREPLPMFFDENEAEPIAIGINQWSQNDYRMSVIWCDINIHDTNENIQIQKELEEVSKSFHPFNDYEACEEHIRHLDTADEVILIVAGSIGSVLIPLVHDATQLCVIYIYSMHEDYYRKQFEGYNKVRRNNFN